MYLRSRFAGNFRDQKEMSILRGFQALHPLAGFQIHVADVVLIDVGISQLRRVDLVGFDPSDEREPVFFRRLLKSNRRESCRQKQKSNGGRQPR